MTPTEFFDCIEADEELRGLGLKDGKAFVSAFNGQLVTSVGMDAIEDLEWDMVREVLVGKREPHVIRHMTRIVGYYSFTNNWSQSKIGELKDRIRGNYIIGEGEHGTREKRLAVAENM